MDQRRSWPFRSSKAEPGRKSERRETARGAKREKAGQIALEAHDQVYEAKRPKTEQREQLPKQLPYYHYLRRLINEVYLGPPV